MPTANTPLIQVLGAIAYGEWKAYDGARSQAAETTDERTRRELRTIAAEELRHHKGFVRELERRGADPDRAMRPFQQVLDTYHGVEARSELEDAVWSYIGEGIADDLLTWLRAVVGDEDTVAFIDSVIADEEHHEARATDELRALLDRTPGGRRQARAAVRRLMLKMATSGGSSGLPLLAFLRVGRPDRLVSALLRGADRRLRAVGIAPLDLRVGLPFARA
jgi:rubrerythrin